MLGCWNLVEKFQMSTPATTSTIQNSRLFNVEFKHEPPTPLSLKITTACAEPSREILGRLPTPATQTIRSSASTTIGTPIPLALGTLRSTSRSCSFCVRPRGRSRSPGPTITNRQSPATLSFGTTADRSVERSAHFRPENRPRPDITQPISGIATSPGMGRGRLNSETRLWKRPALVAG